jgi:hypothetical protein
MTWNPSPELCRVVIVFFYFYMHDPEYAVLENLPAAFRRQFLFGTFVLPFW